MIGFVNPLSLNHPSAIASPVTVQQGELLSFPVPRFPFLTLRREARFNKTTEIGRRGRFPFPVSRSQKR
jgi:hypothetical protein